MKCGGNAAFLDFLSRHPGSYNPSSTDTKEKYLSRGAQLYKEELAKKMAEDERMYGKDRVVVEGAADTAAAPAAKAAGDGDFFDTWDAPPSAAKKPLSPAPAMTPPLVGLGGSRPSTPGGTLLSTPPATSAPRTVTSSSLRTTSSASLNRPKTLGATRTTSSSASTSTLSSSSATVGASSARGKLGAGKLGVKKGGSINFEEAERKAREEEERIKRLGYDRRKEEEEQAAAAAAASAASAAAASKVGANGANSKLQAQAAALQAKKDSGEMERLGMGVRKLGFGQVAGMSGEAAAREAAARKKAAERAASGYVEPGALRCEGSTQATLADLAVHEQKSPTTRGKPSATKRAFRPTCTTRPARTTRTPRGRRSSACKAFRARPPSRASESGFASSVSTCG